MLHSWIKFRQYCYLDLTLPDLVIRAVLFIYLCILVKLI